jgi:hypothetical protein
MDHASIPEMRAVCPNVSHLSCSREEKQKPQDISNRLLQELPPTLRISLDVVPKHSGIVRTSFSLVSEILRTPTQLVSPEAGRSGFSAGRRDTFSGGVTRHRRVQTISSFSLDNMVPVLYFYLD